MGQETHSTQTVGMDLGSSWTESLSTKEVAICLKLLIMLRNLQLQSPDLSGLSPTCRERFHNIMFIWSQTHNLSSDMRRVLINVKRST